MSRDEDRHVIAPPEFLTREARWSALGQRGCTLWFVGLSGSGKSTVAAEVERTLVASGRGAFRLDGDIVRLGLNADLGFGADDRTENLRRLSHVARLMAEAGIVAIVAAISPLRAQRDAARRVHAEAGLPFYEVFVDTPLEVCEARDPKGLYAKARAGTLPEFTGVSSPFEPPTAPDLRLPGDKRDPPALAQQVLQLMSGR